MISRKVIFFLCVVCALAQDNVPQIPKDVDPQPPVPISPTSSTPTPPTTKPTNATTTTQTPITSTKPTIPTTKPTTPSTTSTTTTTTAKPTPTTPSPKPTPTPKPTPPGPPAINKFSGNYSDGTKVADRICLMVNVALQVELMDKNSTKINVPEKVNFTVECPQNSSSSETLTLVWGNHSLVFGFLKNNSRYDVNSINATLLLPNANTTTTLYHVKPEFSVSEKQSYKCSKDQPLNLTDVSKNTIAKLHISHLQYQAFMNTTKDNYDSAWYCDATNTPDIVPVVVGCVLAVLVVLVLVAYLFGRRRCQARGYLSM